ncbi:MAG TPA: carbohydrate ABC transporter permease [Spirochaetia bacterium]|nr:carbohydrate ABC transporter permease [Spirochaetia bacterium]
MAVVQDRSASSRFADFATVAILFFASFVVVIPVLQIVLQSFSATSDLVPKVVSIDAYRYIFSSNILGNSLLVSVYITVLGTALSLILSSLMAYSLSYRSLPGRSGILFVVLFTMLFNGGIIPTYMVVRATGVMNSLWALVIPNAINAFYLIVMKNFFQNIPEELRDSAKIDGCHELVVLLRIVMPLSLPAMAAFGLFYAVDRWNLWFHALLYIADSRKWPVQVVLQQVIFTSVGAVGQQTSDSNDMVAYTSQGIRAAVIIIATLPIALVYPFLQKHFVKGLLVGSIKG